MFLLLAIYVMFLLNVLISNLIILFTVVILIFFYRHINNKMTDTFNDFLPEDDDILASILEESLR
jgi:hypothetical protein